MYSFLLELPFLTKVWHQINYVTNYLNEAFHSQRHCPKLLKPWCLITKITRISRRGGVLQGGRDSVLCSKMFPLFPCSPQRCPRVPLFLKLTCPLVSLRCFGFVPVYPLQNLPCSLETSGRPSIPLGDPRYPWETLDTPGRPSIIKGKAIYRIPKW